MYGLVYLLGQLVIFIISDFVDFNCIFLKRFWIFFRMLGVFCLVFVMVSGYSGNVGYVIVVIFNGFMYFGDCKSIMFFQE